MKQEKQVTRKISTVLLFNRDDVNASAESCRIQIEYVVHPIPDSLHIVHSELWKIWNACEENKRSWTRMSSTGANAGNTEASSTSELLASRCPILFEPQFLDVSISKWRPQSENRPDL